MLFRDFNYVYNARPNRFGESLYLGINLELAGAEFWAVNSLYNSFALEPDTLKLGEIEFSQYISTELDLRYYKQYTTKQSLVLRFNLGVARPFGFTTDVPYVKQLYVGGPNSIRAWAPRGLGPGQYLDSLSLDQANNNRLYQSGDLKIEFNAEYRFDLFWRLKGAVFLDGGNIWTIDKDLSRCGSQFLLNNSTITGCTGNDQTVVNEAFYKQNCSGHRFGFRFDFTYFIFRLDVGIKLRYPYLNEPDENGMLPPRRGYWENFKEDWGIYKNELQPWIGLSFLRSEFPIVLNFLPNSAIKNSI